MATRISSALAKCPDDNVTFGGSLAAAPQNAEDNDTFIVTDTGDATGTPSEVYKYDLESAQWVSIDLDTDIEAVNAALAGTILTVSVTEDGVTLDTTVDLAPFLDDDDITSLSIAAGPNSTTAAPTIQITADGEDAPVVSNEYALPAGAPAEMWELV